jgi:hypothetical protein
MFDYICFGDSEYWVSFTTSGFNFLLTHSETWVLLVLVIFSLTIILRPFS